MKKNRQVISQIAIILIFMVGILTMLYPFYVDALNNVIDQVRVDRYLKESQKEFEAERKRLAEENNKLSDSGLAPGLSLIHISEPTRRTPISYAVFCLKKKKKTKKKT